MHMPILTMVGCLKSSTTTRFFVFPPATRG